MMGGGTQYMGTETTYPQTTTGMVGSTGMMGGTGMALGTGMKQKDIKKANKDIREAELY